MLATHTHSNPINTAIAYLVAIVAALLAALPWILSGPTIEPTPYLLFLAAVIFGAWLGGLGPGLLVTAIDTVALLYGYSSSSRSAPFHYQNSSLQLVLFLLAAISISYLSGALRRLDAEAERRAQGARADMAGAVTRHLGEGVLALDRQGRVVFANPAALHMLGREERDVVGQTLGQVVVEEPGSESSIVPAARETLRSGSTQRVDSGMYVRKDGVAFPVDVVCSPIRSSRGTDGAVLAFRDISERHAFEEQLRHQALHDGLTGLPNRTLFNDRLQQAIATAYRESGTVALFLIDLDRFKEINDTFGHRHGDLLLQQLGPRLQRVVRESDTVARLGGDEFGIILPGSDQAGAAVVAEKIAVVMKEPFRLEDEVLHVQAAIGITVYPRHAEEAITLMQRADIAMYAAKRRAAGHAFYRPDQDSNSASRIALIGELRQAIDEGQLTLYYQPLVDLRDGSRYAVEALVRWNHPDQGLLTPDSFLPLAEQTGLIRDLTLWVLNEALRQCRQWQDTGLHVRVGVNLSAQSLHDAHFPETVRRVLAEWNLAPAALALEVTESSVMTDPGTGADVLRELHTMGVCISIDDFGTGYSSLAYLARLPVDELKIDRSFVLAMSGGADSGFIARSVIDLGHNLGLRVVAEGVETEELRDQLAELGCDVVQGYFLGRPMLPENLELVTDPS